MALIYYVKRAFGFDDTADETEDIDTPFVSASQTRKTADATAAVTEAPDKGNALAAEVDNTDDDMPLVDASLPGCIFDSVIRLFNRTMPDFVRECLDTDSQRQYLYHAIESDVRRQMIRVMEEVRLNAATNIEPKDASATDNNQRQLRTAYNNFRREKEALERRITQLENALLSANEENAHLQNEINTLNRRLRKSRNKAATVDDDIQLSLF